MRATIQEVEQKVRLDVYRHGNLAVRDAYDRVVAGIRLQKKNRDISTITVTGCEPSAGTTTMALELGISMAVSGWKTVIINTNMKKVPNNERMKQKIEFGLSHYLTGDVPLETIFCETNYDNLQYIGCGHTQNNAVELLCSKRFDRLLDCIKERYDMAVFDAPSLDSTIDGSILAAKTEAVILVASQNKTRTTQIEASKRELENVGAVLLGIVLTQVDRHEYKSFLEHYDYFQRLNSGNNKKRTRKKEERHN